MALREVKDFLISLDDPGRNYPFNPKPINPYSKIAPHNKAIYRTNYNKDIANYSDLGYNKKGKALEYGNPKSNSGSYRMAA
jgi:hypothetical protein